MLKDLQHIVVLRDGSLINVTSVTNETFVLHDFTVSQRLDMLL